MPTFLEHQGAALSFELHGDHGPCVLLIHGVGVAGCAWHPQVEALRGHCRVLAFDHRGLGRSTLTKGAPLTIEQMADDAFALAQAEGWSSCHVVGHSMGGLIAPCLALRHPGFVQSLALLNTVANGADAARLTPKKLWLAVRGSLGPRRWRRRAFLQMILAPDELASADPEELAERLGRSFGRDLAEQPGIAMRQLSAMSRFDPRPRLHELRGLPALVVSATHDVIAPARFGRELAGLLPRARYVELPGAGHAAPLTWPREVNELLSAHIAAA